MVTKQLDKGQIAEVKDLYDGTRASVTELSKLMNVGFHVIEYLVDYNGRQKKSKEYSRKWMQRNPERAKEILKKAGITYRKKNIEKIRKRTREYYKKNKEKYSKWHEEYYKKNKTQLHAKARERYRLKKIKQRSKILN